MIRVPTMIAIMSIVFAATQASAADPIARPPMTKRQIIGQIIDCMKKRMYADRAISYNEAAKVCKNQIDVQNDASGPGALVAADTPTK
jgi:hypothetical protein